MRKALFLLGLLFASHAWAAVEPSADELLRQAQTLRAEGFHSRAVASLQQALALSKGNGVQSAQLLNELGATLQLLGLNDEARVDLSAALELAKINNLPAVQAAVLNNLGNVDAALQKKDEAIKDYDQAASLAAGSKDSGLLAQAMLNSARLSGNGEKMAAALAQVKMLADGREKSYALIAAGGWYAAQNDAVQAFQVLTDAILLANRTLDERAGSQASGELGNLYEKQQKYPEALELTQRAIFLGEQQNAPDILYRWYWQKGRILKAQGKKEDAIAAYRLAVAHLQQIRNDLPVNYDASGQSSFRRIFSPLFFELADLLLDRASEASNPDSYLIEARDTVEQTKNAELQDYFQDNCVAGSQKKIVDLSSYANKTAIVYPVLLADRLEILVTFPDRMMRFRVPVTAADITGEIREFRLKLQKRTTREFLPVGQKLYDQLIRPFRLELEARKIDTLVFVPDGALRTIPMAALHDGKKFLVENYALATTPSLTLTDPHRLQTGRTRMLLGGLTDSVQGFSALPNVAGELESIEKTYAPTTLKDKDYVVANVRDKLLEGNYSIVHIASHGQFKGDPKQSFLLTHAEKINMDQLETLISPSRYKEKPIELLTLSACQTAAGDDRAALGLAGIAIKAGARSAVASLWFVNDQSSTELISGFYRQLNQPGSTKAKALQQAQIELISDNRFKHPGYWAPFLLIGNWL